MPALNAQMLILVNRLQQLAGAREHIFTRIRTCLVTVTLAAACGAASLGIRLVQRYFPLWSYGARIYLPVFDRFAAFYALLTCRLAQRTVPAYAQMTHAAGNSFRKLTDYPETNKDNYVKAYGLAERCRHGRLTLEGSSVDESSGSTGVPYNWLRSSRELTDLHFSLANYIRLLFPRENLFCINAFSMGAWGTGMNFTTAMHKVGLVKSVGPDIDTIISTMRTFGTGFNYLITAYPPLLKTLCDELDAIGVSAREYRLFGLVAGEPITEALRDYLLRRFEKILSGYGASDVSIGIAGETDFTVLLRKALSNRKLRYALLGDGEDRIPMIFQYNPLEVFIEENDDSELVFTVTNAAAICPKLRYNVHDEGAILSFDKAVTVIGQQMPDILPEARRGIKLPILFLFGRSDSTISAMGANIYPQDVEHGLYAKPDLAKHIRRFCLSLDEREDLSCMPTVNVELRGEELDIDLRVQMEYELSRDITSFLTLTSHDFANAHKENPGITTIQVRTFLQGEGPFEAQTRSLKNSYLVRLPVNENPS
jgi:phenylacetate-CoA ligase